MTVMNLQLCIRCIICQHRCHPQKKWLHGLILSLAVSALGDTARPMIQDFQQSTAARRWEGQCICCTTNVLEWGLYCLLGRHRLICSSNTPMPCCVGRPPVDRRHASHSPCRLRPRPPGYGRVWDDVAAILTLYAVECRGPRLHARPPTAAAAARDVRSADADADPQEISRTYTDGSPPKVHGSGLTRTSNSSNGKLTHLAQWADVIVLTYALYPSHLPHDHAAQLQPLIVLQWPSHTQTDCAMHTPTLIAGREAVVEILPENLPFSLCTFSVHNEKCNCCAGCRQSNYPIRWIQAEQLTNQLTN